MPSDLERQHLARIVRGAGEVVLMLLAFATAWPFGSVEPYWEAVANVGIAVLAGLWAVHAGLTRRLRLRFDAPALILSGLVLLSGLQLTPLPSGVVQLVSPASVRWREAMQPAVGELLPGETTPVVRPSLFPISLDPTATRLFACRIFGLLVVYLAARNWLASRESFRRLAGIALLNGVALSALALGQCFSSAPNEIFWSFTTSGQVFGPFVCRNHYPDYIALCAGLAIGIMVTKRVPPKLGDTRTFESGTIWDDIQEMLSAPLQLLQQPAVLAAAAGVGLMLISIPFSLSRGGMLSFLAATLGVFLLARFRKGVAGESNNLNRTAVTLATVVALVVVAWFDWAPLEKRFDEINSGQSIDDRTPLWNSTVQQLPGFWLAGAGNGSHLRIEPLGRTDVGIADRVAEHAHNEYLEAAIEGGVLRCGLTLALPLIVLASLALGFRKLHARSIGPLILGATFGLMVVSVHAVTDFGLHIPAVALLATIVAAYGMAAANDSDYQPTRQPRLPSAPTWSGSPALAISASLCLIMVLLTWNAYQRYRSEKYLVAAMDQSRASNLQRIEWLEASVAADPHNPDAYFQLAQANLDASAELGTSEMHIHAALRALRTARELCPLLAEVHARLGLYAKNFSQSEPALLHLERAKLILKSDAQIWYACGVEAAKAGEPANAIAQWKRSLELSPKQLRPILRTAKQTLSPADILRMLLPDDPVVLLGAADEFYPDRLKQRTERRPFLERATTAKRPATTVPQWIAVATASGELDRIDDARKAWGHAIELDREAVPAHEGFARLLEAEELYDEALPQLQWLLAKRPTDPDLRLRYKAAVHGAKLQREIRE